MTTSQFHKSYADFGIQRSLRQIKHAFNNRERAEENMLRLFDSMQLPESRMAKLLGEPPRNKEILEIGPGQGLERARYFGVHNNVIGMDLDVLSASFNPIQYWQMVRSNGVGRVAKTIGRKLIIGRANEAAWAKVSGVNKFTDPEIVYGDISQDVLYQNTFDVVMTWSVFEHIADPKQALENVIASLKPGGIFYISLHLFTAHDGHHDIRAFTGAGDSLPLWGHLRTTHKHLLKPSAYLNEWRIAQWQNLFAEVAPGGDEYLDEYEVRERFGPRMTDDLRAELADYSDEELYTVNMVYAWQKPQ